MEERVERLAERFNAENIKIWEPYLSMLIEKRLDDSVSFLRLRQFRKKRGGMISQKCSTI